MAVRQLGAALALMCGMAAWSSGHAASAPVTSPCARAAVRSSVKLPGGRTLSFLHWINPAKPAVLLLHGKTGNAADFLPLAARWQDRFDIYAVDMRGRGFSDWAPDGDYTVESTLTDLKQFTAILGLTRFGIWGASYGAVIGLGYAAAHPDQVQFLILDDGGPVNLPGGVPAPLNPGQFVAVGSPTVKPVPMIFAKWSDVENGCQARCTEAQLESRFIRTPTGIVERSDVLGLWASKRGSGFDDQWPAVDELRAPTLILRAEHGLLPEAIVEAIKQRNPRVRSVAVKGAKHTVETSRPEAAYQAAEAFLSEVPR